MQLPKDEVIANTATLSGENNSYDSLNHVYKDGHQPRQQAGHRAGGGAGVHPLPVSASFSSYKKLSEEDSLS